MAEKTGPNCEASTGFESSILKKSFWVFSLAPKWCLLVKLSNYIGTAANYVVKNLPPAD